MPVMTEPKLIAGNANRPLATAIAALVNVTLLARTLAKRGQLVSDAQLARRAPRLLLAALLMGTALWFGAGPALPWLTGSLIERGTALALLVGAGAAVYALACFATGAFRVADLRSLLRRRASSR